MFKKIGRILGKIILFFGLTGFLFPLAELGEKFYISKNKVFTSSYRDDNTSVLNNVLIRNDSTISILGQVNPEKKVLFSNIESEICFIREKINTKPSLWERVIEQIFPPSQLVEFDTLWEKKLDINQIVLTNKDFKVTIKELDNRDLNNINITTESPDGFLSSFLLKLPNNTLIKTKNVKFQVRPIELETPFSLVFDKNIVDFSYLIDSKAIIIEKNKQFYLNIVGKKINFDLQFNLRKFINEAGGKFTATFIYDNCSNLAIHNGEKLFLKNPTDKKKYVFNYQSIKEEKDQIVVTDEKYTYIFPNSTYSSINKTFKSGNVYIKKIPKIGFLTKLFFYPYILFYQIIGERLKNKTNCFTLVVLSISTIYSFISYILWKYFQTAKNKIVSSFLTTTIEYGIERNNNENIIFSKILQFVKRNYKELIWGGFTIYMLLPVYIHTFHRYPLNTLYESWDYKYKFYLKAKGFFLNKSNFFINIIISLVDILLNTKEFKTKELLISLFFIATTYYTAPITLFFVFFFNIFRFEMDFSN